MVVTIEHVLAKIYPEEPDYDNAAKLGPEALPHLEIIVKIAEPMLAAKATSMTSHINDPKSVDILKIAARSKDVTVRVAAAAGSRNLKIPSVREVLDLLKDDEDEGVRRIATKSIESVYGRIEPES